MNLAQKTGQIFWLTFVTTFAEVRAIHAQIKIGIQQAPVLCKVKRGITKLSPLSSLGYDESYLLGYTELSGQKMGQKHKLLSVRERGQKRGKNRLRTSSQPQFIPATT